MRLNPDLFPPGGYKFKDDGIEFIGTSVKQLARQVADYRKRNDRHPGFPEEEIEEQICERSPHVCREDEPSVPVPTGSDVTDKAFASAVVGELGRLFATGVTAVADDEEVERRAAICAACPKNRDWESHCPPCKRRAARVLTQILKPGEPYAPLKGRGCAVAIDDLSVAVKVDPFVATEHFPPHCWRSTQEEKSPEVVDVTPSESQVNDSGD